MNVKPSRQRQESNTHLELDDIISTKTVFAGVKRDTAAEDIARYANVSDTAAHGTEAKRLKIVVHVDPSITRSHSYSRVVRGHSQCGEIRCRNQNSGGINAVGTWDWHVAATTHRELGQGEGGCHHSARDLLRVLRHKDAGGSLIKSR